MTRPSWHEYFLNIAQAVSLRADCTRRQVGVVIVKNNRIVSTGYNGSPSGFPGCLTDGGCPRGKHYLPKFHPFDDRFEKVCACGGGWPCPLYVSPGSSYDNCVSCHAEANALIYSSKDRCEGAVLYCTDEPCFSCWKLIAGAGIEEVVTPGGCVKVVRRLRSIYEGRSSEQKDL